MSAMRYLLVAVADDEMLFRQAIERIQADGWGTPLCEVTTDVMDDGLLQRIKAIHLVQEAREHGRQADE